MIPDCLRFFLRLQFCVLFALCATGARGQFSLIALPAAPTVGVGEELVVHVYVSPAQRLAGIGFQLTFDASLLQFAGATRGHALPDASDMIEFGPSVQTVSGVSVVAYGGGTMGATPFNVSAGSTLVYALRFNRRAGIPAGQRFRFTLQEVDLQRVPVGSTEPESVPSVDVQHATIDEARETLTVVQAAIPAGSLDQTFPDVSNVRLVLNGVDAPATITLREERTGVPPGTSLPAQTQLLTDRLWTVEVSRPLPGLQALLCFPAAGMASVFRDQAGAIRILRRADAQGQWHELPTSLRDDEDRIVARNPTRICAEVSGFSDFTATAPQSAVPPFYTDPAEANISTGGAAWRILGVPGGTTVSHLAGQNLVQGVPGRRGLPFYPAAQPNLFVGYNGTTWINASDGDTLIASGQGVAWYFFDLNLTPGGPSNSRVLPFSLTGSALPPGVDVTVNLHASGNRWNVLANPFAEPLSLEDLASWTGAEHVENLEAQVWAFNATSSTWSYELAQDRSYRIAPWEGFVLRAATPGALTIPARDRLSALVGSGDSSLRSGLVASARACPVEGRVRFTLRGTSTSGQALEDRSASLVFQPCAQPGRDRYDVGKLVPLQSSYVALTLGNEAEPLALDARPPVRDGAPVPLFVKGVGAQTSATLAWEAKLPDGISVWLHDRLADTFHPLTPTGALPVTVDQPLGAALVEEDRTFPASAQQPALSASSRYALVFDLPRPSPPAENTGDFTVWVEGAHPVQTSLRIGYRTSSKEPVRVALYDMLGRLVATHTLSSAPGGALSDLSVAGLPAGLYALVATSAGHVWTNTVVVAR